jgi:hypothetical protein
MRFMADGCVEGKNMDFRAEVPNHSFFGQGSVLPGFIPLISRLAMHPILARSAKASISACR